MLRLPRDGGGQWPRLTSTHAFWQALEEIAQFWDGSKDEYYEVDVPEEGNGGDAVVAVNGAEKMDIDASGNNTSTSSSTPAALVADSTIGASTSTTPPSTSPAPPKNGKKQVYRGRRSANGASMPEETLERAARSLLDIAGRAFRCHSIKKRSLFSPQGPTRLTIRDVRLPVTHHLDLGLVPADYKLARKGHIEGPVMGVHVRTQVRFREEGEEEGRGQGECWDFYREVGSCLLLAQKRGREGKDQGGKGKSVGEDRWWGVRRRWGGGRGGNMPHESDEEPCDDISGLVAGGEKRDDGEDSLILNTDDEKACSEEGKGNPRKRPSSSGKDNRRVADFDTTRSSQPLIPPSDVSEGKGLAATADSIEVDQNVDSKDQDKGKMDTNTNKKGHTPRYLRMMDEYRSLKLSAPTHDERIKYRRIGMVRDRRRAQEQASSSEGEAPPTPTTAEEGTAGKWDDIFVLTAVNHHVALLKMRVHEDYLAWLEHGEIGEAKHGARCQGRLSEGPDSEVSDHQSGEREQPVLDMRPDTLYMQRTRWFDLLDAADRVEVCVGLWAVLGWMVRDEGPAVNGGEAGG